MTDLTEQEKEELDFKASIRDIVSQMSPELVQLRRDMEARTTENSLQVITTLDDTQKAHEERLVRITETQIDHFNQLALEKGLMTPMEVEKTLKIELYHVQDRVEMRFHFEGAKKETLVIDSRMFEGDKAVQWGNPPMFTLVKIGGKKVYPIYPAIALKTWIGDKMILRGVLQQESNGRLVVNKTDDKSSPYWFIDDMYRLMQVFQINGDSGYWIIKFLQDFAENTVDTFTRFEEIDFYWYKALFLKYISILIGNNTLYEDVNWRFNANQFLIGDDPVGQFGGEDHPSSQLVHFIKFLKKVGKSEYTSIGKDAVDMMGPFGEKLHREWKYYFTPIEERNPFLHAMRFAVDDIVGHLKKTGGNALEFPLNYPQEIFTGVYVKMEHGESQMAPLYLLYETTLSTIAEHMRLVKNTGRGSNYFVSGELSKERIDDIWELCDGLRTRTKTLVILRENTQPDYQLVKSILGYKATRSEFFIVKKTPRLQEEIEKLNVMAKRI